MNFAKLFSALFLLVLLNCSPCFAKKKTAKQEAYANQISQEFIGEMEKKYGCVCSEKKCFMSDQVEGLRIDFTIKHRATIEEARALEVMAIERLVQMVNNHEKIRPYLAEYPFPAWRAKIGFSFVTPYNGQPFVDGSLSKSFQCRGKLRYEWLSAKTSYRVLEEPYEEAKRILESSPIPNPSEHQGKPHEPIMDAIFSTYLKEMDKEYHLESGTIKGALIDGVEEISVHLIYLRHPKIEQARELQVVATERLLDVINSNEELKPYIKDYPFSVDKLKVTIRFINRDIFSCREEAINFAFLDKEQIKYCCVREPGKNWTAKFPVLAEESYQDSLKKVKMSPRAKKLKIKWRDEV